MEETINHRQKPEVADIIKSCPDFAEYHPLCPVQQKAMDDIISCRTARLGGHVNCCNHCGYEKNSYNSCRNRHCPKCQFIKQEQ